MKSNHKKLFGTDGIRGTVNGDKVNALMAVNIAMAAGEYFYGKAGTKRPRVLIGKDTRLSGYMLEPALVAGFTSIGIEAITTGPLPTPGRQLGERMVSSESAEALTSAASRRHQLLDSQRFDWERSLLASPLIHNFTM